jgi:hypothetical protein
MLKTTEYKPNDIITLKLNSGEEIIGVFVEATGFSITITRPFALIATENGMGLAPYVMTADVTNPSLKQKFNTSSIVLDFKTGKQFADHYIQQMKGLDTPPSKLVR